MSDVDTRPEVQALVKALNAAHPALKTLLAEQSDEWRYEDPIYRFYHHSFKVYYVQESTVEIVAALQALMPDRRLNKTFTAIVQAGTDKEFEMKHNDRWLEETGPILQAFFHARFFLEMAVRYGGEPSAPTLLPSGWAAFLYLYNLR